ncbi:glycoside hydrolase family 16 protein [Parathielavia hyrcaniae]|uniref:Glycoside hydrolase family 16 protein n=1 Tax=Parathielavia hyrcaniae TaxID=113614 RepID=A0AAN6Q4G6_9PEZI|nr:glycoside hydrolase family 16 protein [Parathielavia hyrcaniae]
MRFHNILSGLALGLPLIQGAIPSIPGFTLTWGEDFAGPAGSLPDPANWIINTGHSYPGGPANWGTGEIQEYTSDTNNVRHTGNGRLQIIAHKEGHGGWTSARIESRRADFVCRQGGRMRIEVSLSLPAVQQPIGYWPAFWTLGAAYRGQYWNWPAIGEFDIMENVNGINRVWGVLHCGVNPGGPCFETDGRPNNRVCPGAPCQGNFHRYTFEVDRTQPLEAIRWFVDGIIYHQVVSTDLPADVWRQAVHNPHFVLLNLAMGGAFPNKEFGNVTPLPTTTSGGVLEAEYIAVYNS